MQAPMSLESPMSGRDRDPYGRLLRTVERNGQTRLAAHWFEEGLARWYEGVDAGHGVEYC
jgi:endonuclease YncB( thermonuclease family)